MPTPAPIVKDENYYAVKKVGRASWSNSIIPFIFLGYGIFLFVMGLNMDDSISTQSMFINASSQICVAFIFFIAWERIKQSDFKGVLIGLFSLAFMFGMLAFVSFVILHNAKRINNSLLGACIVSLVYASIFIGIKFAKKKKQLKVG